MALSFFTLTARLTAVVVDYVDIGTQPDLQGISATVEFRPRIGTGKIVWASGATPPQGFAFAPFKARFDTDGVLRTIQNTPVNEIQTVTVTGNPFTLSFSGSPSTANLPDTATPAAVETALEGLSTVGASNVNVTGPNGGPYDVTFNDALGNQDVPLMSATNATVTVKRAGTLAAGVELVANTSDLGLGTYDPATETGGLVYDVILTNVRFNKSAQEIHPFAFAAPTTGGGTVDLATVAKLPPKPPNWYPKN
ncbi:MAG: hypothetical protein K2X00_24035 [Nitrospiraceae bacterium]|nr:hypothetical protein [Nitrospiraceae bacterium]